MWKRWKVFTAPNRMYKHFKKTTICFSMVDLLFKILVPTLTSFTIIRYFRVTECLYKWAIHLVVHNLHPKIERKITYNICYFLCSPTCNSAPLYTRHNYLCLYLYGSNPRILFLLIVNSWKLLLFFVIFVI